MPDTWLVRVYHDRLMVTFKECAAPVELGRQDNRVGEVLFRVTASPAAAAGLQSRLLTR